MKSDRLRYIVFIIVLAVWVVVVAAYLLNGQFPDAPILGIPAALWFAMNSSAVWRREDPPGREPPTVDPPLSPPAPAPNPVTEERGTAT